MPLRMTLAAILLAIFASTSAVAEEHEEGTFARIDPEAERQNPSPAAASNRIAFGPL